MRSWSVFATQVGRCSIGASDGWNQMTQVPNSLDASEFHSRTRVLLGDDAFARLAAMRVAIFGLGGVGGWCAEALARSGVGSMLLVDFDSVAPSNMNRQIMASVNTIGGPKARVLASRFAEIAPDCKVEYRIEKFSQDNADSFDLGLFDFIVDAIDSVDCKVCLIQRALAQEKPRLISSMGAALRLDPTRIRISPFRKVEGDGLARALRNRFRRSLGHLPERNFDCVWSTELPCQTPDKGVKGSVITVTAAFGLTIASLILSAAQAS